MKIPSLASADIRQEETTARILTSAMTTPSSISSGKKGQEFCRPADWTDVAKFLLFNYGLHAFTALSKPGDGIAHRIHAVARSILMPYATILVSMKALLLTPSTNPLKLAQQSSALCMMRHLETTPDDYISPTFTHVHGQIPITSFRFQLKDPFGYRRLRKPVGVDDYLVPVPVDGFSVLPPKPSKNEPNSFSLASSYNLLKALAGIIQVLYGSLELYEARGRQLEKYGYAAYSLTVIPYISMSLVNLLVAAYLPQYPSMYVVIYGGKRARDETTGNSRDEPASDDKPSEEPAGEDEIAR